VTKQHRRNFYVHYVDIMLTELWIFVAVLPVSIIVDCCYYDSPHLGGSLLLSVVLPGRWVRGASWRSVSNQVDGSGGCQLQSFHYQVGRLVVWNSHNRNRNVRTSAVSRSVPLLFFLWCSFSVELLFCQWLNVIFVKFCDHNLSFIAMLVCQWNSETCAGRSVHMINI